MIKYPDKEKTIEKFKEKYLNNTWVDNFIKADEFYRENKERIDLSLTNTFDLLCELCVKMQKENLKGDINYIYFSLLRTSIREHKGECRVDFYDENWFLDKNECSVNLNLDFLYSYLWELEDMLKDKKKEYGRTISDLDVEYMILEESDKYNVLCTEFLKDIILNKFVDTPSYREIKKNTKLKILVGEFMDTAELVFDSERPNLADEENDINKEIIGE